MLTAQRGGSLVAAPPRYVSYFFSRFDQLVIQPLMVALSMIVATELFDAISKRPLAEEDHFFEAFFLD